MEHTDKQVYREEEIRKENGKLREYTNYSHILLDTELPNKTERMLTIAEINNTIA